MMVDHICNPSTLKGEGRDSGVQGHLQLHREFKASLEILSPNQRTK